MGNLNIQKYRSYNIANHVGENPQPDTSGYITFERKSTKKCIKLKYCTVNTNIGNPIVEYEGQMFEIFTVNDRRSLYVDQGFDKEMPQHFESNYVSNVLFQLRYRPLVNHMLLTMISQHPRAFDYYIIEHFPLGDLYTYTKNNVLETDVVIDIGRQLCEAMRIVKTKHMFHWNCDLYLLNTMTTKISK
jgi:hypothetical protein